MRVGIRQPNLQACAKVARAPLGRFGRRLEKLRSFADELDRKVDLPGNLRPRKGASMFLFTDEAALAASNPLEVEWISGKREVIRWII